jgi:hypothetical protein
MAPRPVRPAYRPSPPLLRWRSTGRAQIDELVAAHRAVGGSRPGRRTATQQINHALVVQLAAQFQRYCRELHDACCEALVACAPAEYRPTLNLALRTGRRLNAQSAQPASLGSDFGRFGFDFWPAVQALGPSYVARRRRLEQVAVWRNAIAHQDFRRLPTDASTAGTRADLPTVRTWHRALDQLAGGIDRVMHREIARITGGQPW